MKVLVDTNILLDCLCRREGFCANAERIFQMGYDGQIDLAICALSFVNGCYTGRKYGYSTETIQASMLGLRKFCQVAPLTAETIDAALKEKTKDFEDIVQIEAAKSIHCDAIVTRDGGGFKTSPLPVYSPQALIDLMRTTDNHN